MAVLSPCSSAYDVTIAAEGKALVKTDIAIAIPAGHYGRVGVLLCTSCILHYQLLNSLVPRPLSVSPQLSAHDVTIKWPADGWGSGYETSCCSLPEVKLFAAAAGVAHFFPFLPPLCLQLQDLVWHGSTTLIVERVSLTETTVAMLASFFTTCPNRTLKVSGCVVWVEPLHVLACTHHCTGCTTAFEAGPHSRSVCKYCCPLILCSFLFAVKRGDRIAQLILERISTPPVLEVKELDDTQRGAGGFGSTGRN